MDNKVFLTKYLGAIQKANIYRKRLNTEEQKLNELECKINNLDKAYESFKYIDTILVNAISDRIDTLSKVYLDIVAKSLDIELKLNEVEKEIILMRKSQLTIK